MSNNNEIIVGDCLKVLKSFEDNFFSHTITSPPYNMNLRIRNGKYCSRQIVKEFSTKYNGFDDNLSIEDYFNFHKKVIAELLRVTKGYIFYIIQPVTGNKRAL
jgi:site-specific DNA-methyltransferase (adenine-specific)/modification methylase